MWYTVDVDVVLDDGLEDTVEVEIDLDEYRELEDEDERIKYIEKKTRKQHKNVEDVQVSDDVLEEIEDEIEDIEDVSDMLPNESYDEFMEHEDHDW